MNELAMQLREASPAQRIIVGVVAPYDEVSYLTPHAKGETIRRGAFGKSIAERGLRIPLFLAHQHGVPIGLSRSWSDDAAGLTGTFYVSPGASGDEALAAAEDGRLSGMSVAFLPVQQGRGAGGVMEVREAKLAEVSLTAIPAYEAAEVLAVREAAAPNYAQQVLAALPPAPQLDLTPMPLIWTSARARA
jgi:hypothetical protein